MTTLAIVPSTSVALVVTRSATLGIANGTAVSLGIVIGDLVYIFIAILGLSAIAETMGRLFLSIKYIGAVYLLWLGFTLLTVKNKTANTLNNTKEKSNLITSFLAGLFLTLGEMKAIFFYVSSFPTSLDLATLNMSDIFIIMLVTIVAVGGVKIFYDFLARKVVAISNGFRFQNSAKKAAGSYSIVKV